MALIDDYSERDIPYCYHSCDRGFLHLWLTIDACWSHTRAGRVAVNERVYGNKWRLFQRLYQALEKGDMFDGNGRVPLQDRLMKMDKSRLVDEFRQALARLSADVDRVRKIVDSARWERTEKAKISLDAWHTINGRTGDELRVRRVSIDQGLARLTTFVEFTLKPALGPDLKPGFLYTEGENCSAMHVGTLARRYLALLDRLICTATYLSHELPWAWEVQRLERARRTLETWRVEYTDSWKSNGVPLEERFQDQELMSQVRARVDKIGQGLGKAYETASSEKRQKEEGTRKWYSIGGGPSRKLKGYMKGVNNEVEELWDFSVDELYHPQDTERRR
ncbi:hypothetical protein BJY00DRAFT_319291 [Aspergillus carlsbadensis]|nr:hypothetical protein BJY00DRAFT_319291 [Aspergillus carlsbadensis]